ncbi:MAG TPA: neutral/alkaline non-lysosomal ceramidase N-terminal domain-containing protein [Bacteroidales bacterium]|nr:neutral/alkaline non-lysosomal ceramidase N-terminal domain-containing protein [Bacteroidales bacterium]HQH24316.1 neutral/alkaline non-lysosomal ceramidase N-terminal domain-containing protein [Bacteroidales bacterium]HQJ81551.1 neutral/alkaline non-lysosomal ceramidase N-terminal domain-containing protein [Bacteroidales bacterium]
MKIKRLLPLTVLLIFSVSLCGQGLQQAKSGSLLRAGTARTDITPALPVKLYGYASRKTYSEGVHDPLSARVVVFENNGRRLLLVSTDIGSYGNEVYHTIRKAITDRFGFSESEIFLSTIHTHSSPTLTVNSQTGDPNNIEYTKFLQERLLAAIDEAIRDLRPVTAGAGKGSSPVGANRREMQADGSIKLGRNPEGITDKEVVVMKIATPDGRPLAALYDYATHSTSLGPRNMLVSGDVLGLSAQFVEKILGKDVIAPVFTGASGNIDPWYRVLPEFSSEPGWIPEPVLLGNLLGVEVVHVFRGIRETDLTGDISTDFAILECPRKITAEAPSGTDQPSVVPVHITAARIGKDVAFIGFNVEMLTEIGMEIKAGSPFRYTFIITHCNGSAGYLAPAGLYKEGGYEVESSRFAIGSSDMVVKKALRMLYDL